MNSGRPTLDTLHDDVIEYILCFFNQISQVHGFLLTSKRNLGFAHFYLFRNAKKVLDSYLNRLDFLPILPGNSRLTGEMLIGCETLNANFLKTLYEFEKLVNFEVYSQDNKEDFIKFLASDKVQGVNSVHFWQIAMFFFFAICGHPVCTESERKICFITSENLYITKTFFCELVKINPLTHLPYYKAMFENTDSAFDNKELNDAAKNFLTHLALSGLPDLSLQLERWLDATLFRGSHSSDDVERFSSLIRARALEKMKLDFSAFPAEEGAYKEQLIQSARFEYDSGSMIAICRIFFERPLIALRNVARFVPNTPNFLMVLNPPLLLNDRRLFRNCYRSLQTKKDEAAQSKYKALIKIIDGAVRMVFENNILIHADDIKIKISRDKSPILDITYRLFLSHPGLKDYLYSYVFAYLTFNGDFKNAEQVGARFLKTMKELEGTVLGLDLFLRQDDSFHFGRCVSDVVAFLPRLYNLSPQFLDLYLLFLQSETRTMALDKSSRFFFLLFKEWIDSGQEQLARAYIDDHALFNTAENRECIVKITEIIAVLCSKHLAAPPFSFTNIMSPRSLLWKIPLKDILSWLSFWVSIELTKDKEMLMFYLISLERIGLDWSFLGLNFLKLSNYNYTDEQEKSPRKILILHIIPLLPYQLLQEVMAKIKKNIQRNALPTADLEHLPGFTAYVITLKEYFGVFDLPVIHKLGCYAFIWEDVPGIVFKELYGSYFILDSSGVSSTGSGRSVKPVPRGNLKGGISLSDLVFTILKKDDLLKDTRSIRLIECIIQYRNDADFIGFICRANDLEPASLIKKVDQYFYEPFPPKTANSEALAAAPEKPASAFDFPFMTFASKTMKPDPAPSNATPPEGAAVTQLGFPSGTY